MGPENQEVESHWCKRSKGRRELGALTPRTGKTGLTRGFVAEAFYEQSLQPQPLCISERETHQLSFAQPAATWGSFL